MSLSYNIDVSFIANDLVREVCAAEHSQAEVKSIVDNLALKAAELKNINHKLHLDLVNACSDISDYYEYDEGTYSTKFLKANGLIKEKSFTNALILLHDALDYFTKIDNKQFVFRVYNSLAAAEIGLNNNDTALRYLLDSLKLQEGNSDLNERAYTKSKIGLAFYALGNFSESLAFHHKALAEYKEADNFHQVTYCLLNIGIIYLHEKQLSLANQYFNGVLTRIEDVDDKVIEAKVYYYIGKVYEELENLPSAVDYYQKAISQWELAKEATEVADCHYMIGNIYLKTKNYADAVKQLGYAFSIMHNNAQINREIRCCEKLVFAYEKIEDFKNALKFERILNAIKTKNINKLREAKRKRSKGKFIEDNDDVGIKIMRLKKDTKTKEQNSIQLRDFASMVSHDLREPLRSIVAFSELVQRKHSHNLDKNGQEFLNLIVDSGKLMSKMLTDLRMYALVGVEDTEMEDCNLNDIFTTIQRNLYIKFIETESVIKVAKDLPIVRYNYTKLVQLFQNLISNGIKFHKEDEKPIIEVLFTETESHITIGIKDNGIGIPDDSKKYIFNIFKRLDYNAKYEGTGVGLAICNQIAQQLSGDIRVESELNIGSTFFVDIPKCYTVGLTVSV